MHRLFRVGDRHRAERVAVIAVGEAEETIFPGLPHVAPVLQRDLERNLDGDRSGIREENARQARRRQRRQPAGQPRAPARAPGRRTSRAASSRVAVPRTRGYAGDCSRGRRSTTTRCRRSARGRRPARCGSRASARPATAAGRPASGSKGARREEDHVHTSRGA